MKLEYTSDTGFKTRLCSYNPKHAAYSSIPKPLKLKSSGGITEDVTWSWFSDAIVTPDVYDLFKSHGFTGCTFSRVELYNMYEELTGQEAYHLEVTGWGGVASPESGVRVIMQCPVCEHAVYESFNDSLALFNEKRWDGSDVFMIWPLPKTIFITERVKNMIETFDIGGVEIIPLKRIRTSIDGTLIPGSVWNYLPENIAKRAEMDVKKGIITLKK